MEPTIKANKLREDASKEILNLSEYIKHSDLESSLAKLVKIRTSQINCCNHCVDKHKKEARAAGESRQRLRGVTAWTEFPFYNDRERAALAWTEVLSRIPKAEVNNDMQQLVSEYFEEFSKRYKGELTQNEEVVNQLLKRAENQQVTLLYAAKDEQHNHAIILKEFLDTYQFNIKNESVPVRL